MTAGSDYESGPYTVTFTAGEMSAALMVSTMDDNTTELSEYFNVMITSTDQPGAVEIGPSDMALVTFEDNDQGVCAQLKVFVHSCVFVCEYIMGCDKWLVYKDLICMSLELEKHVEFIYYSISILVCMKYIQQQCGWAYIKRLTCCVCV